MKSRAVLWFPALLLTVACGSDAPMPEPETVSPRLDVSSCSAAWRVVFTPPQETIKSWVEDLRWHGQRLYYRQALALEPGIRSLPAAGGPAALIHAGPSRAFWIEDERLLVLSNTELSATPLGGGPAQVILSGGMIAEQERLTLQWGLDREALYWARWEGSPSMTPWSLWRAKRDGGTQESLGVIPLPPNNGIVEAILPAGDQVIVLAGAGERAWTVSKTGGPVREVPAPASGRPGVIGVADDGTVLWRHFGVVSTGKGAREGYLISRGRGDAAPQPFWSEKPPEVYPMTAWSRGAGAWFVAAWERGTDEALHTAVWAVTAEGKGTRLACDPEVESRILEGAVSPGGLHGVVDYTNDYWAIVTIAPPGGP